MNIITFTASTQSHVD